MKKNKEKIKAIKIVIKWLKADYGTCKEFEFGCYSCYATLVIKFLEDYAFDSEIDDFVDSLTPEERYKKIKIK